MKTKKATDLEYLALHLESLTELLIERGIITRQDLQRTMRIVDLDDDRVDNGLHIDMMRRSMRPRPEK